MTSPDTKRALELMATACEAVEADFQSEYNLSEGEASRAAVLQRNVCRALAWKLREIMSEDDDEVTEVTP